MAYSPASVGTSMGRLTAERPGAHASSVYWPRRRPVKMNWPAALVRTVWSSSTSLTEAFGTIAGGVVSRTTPPMATSSSTAGRCVVPYSLMSVVRSEEHTSELQSHHDLVCRLLLEKKK